MPIPSLYTDRLSPTTQMAYEMQIQEYVLYKYVQ